MNSNSLPTLRIENLTVNFGPERPILQAVDLAVPEAALCAVVGRSGSGKSMTLLAILDLLPAQARLQSGRFFLAEQEITGTRRAQRGRAISYIPQNPMSSLNPIRTVQQQFAETIHLNQPRAGKEEIRERTVESLQAVQLWDVEKVLTAYPFELSGGMCQRVLIALALLSQPQIVLADEPTTALDVTTQAEILLLLKDLSQRFGFSILLVTHDLPLVAQSCQYMAVLQDGRFSAMQPVNELLGAWTRRVSPEKVYEDLLHAAQLKEPRAA